MEERINKEKLEKIFSNVNYYVEKMYGYGPYSEPLRKVGLEMVEGELKDFCNVLKDMKIDLDKHIGIKDVYKQLEYPMSELKKYFNKGIGSHINNRDAEIFVWYVDNRLSELKEMAIEIEQEYFEKRI